MHPTLDSNISDLNAEIATAFSVENSFADDVAVLCESCKSIPIDRLLKFPGEKHMVSNGASRLRVAAKWCKLCNMLLSSIDLSGIPDPMELHIYVEPQSFVTQSDSAQAWSLCLPKLSVGLGSPAESGTVNRFSILPEAGGRFQIALLIEWLLECDQTHNHAPTSLPSLPTRVVEIGSPENPNSLRLRDTKGFENGRYIALSHRWGGDLEGFKTTKANVSARLQKLNPGDLPKTFQDAVYITRKLGVQFLWIDSLCIVQDDEDDWAREAMLMEEVFASAYCTIAATSATDGGFLHRSQSVRVGNTSVCAYVSQTHADFDQDVGKGALNQRGWVLQERALSRRTIHFTATQIYWECGSAIRSETDETTRPLDVLSSSDFPKPTSSDHPIDELSMFRYVFTTYSRLALTRKEDRPIAIAGLEYRLATSYRTQSVYGIVRNIFAQTLLWQRSWDELNPLIEYNTEVLSWSVGREKVPSWSWMAYEGEISYGMIPSSGLAWNVDISFVFTNGRCALVAPLALSSRCRIHFRKPNNWVIRDKNGESFGWIRYDHENEDGGNLEHSGWKYLERLECIRLAEGTINLKDYADVCWEEDLGDATFSYVLLVAPITSEGGHTEKAYRRLGVAIIQREHLTNGRIVQVL